MGTGDYYPTCRMLALIWFMDLPVFDCLRMLSLTVGEFDNSSGTDRSSTQELRQAFFANPFDWWNNQKKQGSLLSSNS